MLEYCAIIPPRAASNKVIIIPLLFKGKEELVLNKAKELQKSLGSEINAIIDDRNNVSAGFKFNEWELKGIPIRIEIGPRDLEENKVIIARRDLTEKKSIDLKKDLKDFKKVIEKELEDMHNAIFEKAKKAMEDVTVEITDFKSFEKAINEGKRCLVPWAESKKSEDEIKEKIGVKSSCIPFKYKDKRFLDRTARQCEEIIAEEYTKRGIAYR